MADASSPITVLLVDDAQFVLQALESYLNGENGFQVVGAATNVVDALEVLSSQKPDVAVIDIFLPNQSGLVLIESAARVSPATRLIALTGSSDLSIVRRCFVSGAHGLLYKTSTAEHLVEAIRAAANGTTVVDARATAAFLALTPDPADTVPTVPSRTTNVDKVELTPREREILEAVATGASNEQIGLSLGIAEQSVKNHALRIYKKLGVRTRTGAIAAARKRGLLR